jgi:hypothetical protein
MISKQTIYRTQDGRAVPEGDKDARFLIVRAGSEISEKEIAKFEGAAELAGAEIEEPEPEPDDKSKPKRGRPAKK